MFVIVGAAGTANPALCRFYEVARPLLELVPCSSMPSMLVTVLELHRVEVLLCSILIDRTVVAGTAPRLIVVEFWLMALPMPIRVVARCCPEPISISDRLGVRLCSAVGCIALALLVRFGCGKPNEGSVIESIRPSLADLICLTPLMLTMLTGIVALAVECLVMWALAMIMALSRALLEDRLRGVGLGLGVVRVGNGVSRTVVTAVVRTPGWGAPTEILGGGLRLGG